MLPRLDPIVKATEELVLQHNPDWSAADWSGHMPTRPDWSRKDFDMPCFFYYDELIPFTHDSWRGRMRAHRGISATLSPDAVETFDANLASLLNRIAGPSFKVLHRLHAQIFQLK
jgi:hypothetical protein